MANGQRFEQLLRPIYEARSTIAWLVAAVWMALCALVINATTITLLSSAGLAAAMAMLRMVGARRLLNYKLALAGKDVRVIPTSTLQKAMKDMGNNLWLGWGYRWEPRHTQRAYEIMKRDLVDVYPWWRGA